MNIKEQYAELAQYWQRVSEDDPDHFVQRVSMVNRYSTAWWMVSVLNHWMGVMMARGKDKPVEGDSGNGKQWTRFVDIPVSGIVWADVLAKYGSGDTISDGVSTLCASGYRIGISYNPQTDAFIVSVTCKDVDSANNGCTFTAFAGTWYEALQLALFKHFVVTGGRWLEHGGPSQLPAFG